VNPVECEGIAADLAWWLSEQVWAEIPGPHVAGVQYEVLGCDDLDTVDEEAIVLRRADGQVLDVDLQVTVTPHRSARPTQEPLPLEPAP
jgi:hypothetical protein